MRRSASSPVRHHANARFLFRAEWTRALPSPLREPQVIDIPIEATPPGATVQAVVGVEHLRGLDGKGVFELVTGGG